MWELLAAMIRSCRFLGVARVGAIEGSISCRNIRVVELFAVPCSPSRVRIGNGQGIRSQVTML